MHWFERLVHGRQDSRALGAEYDKRLLNIFSKADGRVTPGYHLERHLDKWMNLSPLHQYPLPWGVLPPSDDPSDPHRWFLFRPPFWGFLFRFWYEGEGFWVDRELFLDPPRGLVGNIVTLDRTDGWDVYISHDEARVRADAQIAFGFVPPVAGILQVVVDVQCVQGRYDLTIRDNLGLSGAAAAQYNYVMMSLLYPNAPEVQLALMDESHAESDGDNLSIQNNHLNVVQHYFADFFSAAPVRAGETIIVTVGTQSLDIGQVNTMDLHSRSNFQWFVSSVEVRIVP
jgi:hypothetical protein